MTGNGIASITKTGTDGLVDTYTITYTNGNTTTFTITNGEDGEVTETELNVLRQKVANQQKVIDQLPQVTGQGTSITLENTIEAPFTKFDVEGNSTQDGTPSPDNEVPILSSGDNGSINEKINNKNVINIQPFTVTGGTTSYNGRNFTINLKAGTYTLQRKYTKSSNAPSSAGMVQLKRNNVYYKNLDGGVASTIVELTEDTALTLSFYLSTSITSSSSSSIDFYDIQLEPGSTESSYVPHEEQDYSIFVQQPFRSIGDVRDCFVKKSDGWYERHYIGELGLDGTENWSRSDTTGFIRYVITLANMKSVGSVRSTDILCNIFKPSKENGYNNCFAFNNTVAFYVPENIEDFGGFKELLQEKNAKLQYELAEPLDLPCTTEQVEQLENKPSTYKDFTIIQSQDETKAYLEVAGIYDLNKLINN